MATILVVDDSATNREFLGTLLGYRQHRVIEAGDGREALAMARTDRPELIISDILMPSMDGYEFVRQVRADPSIAATTVIFTSAHYLDREAQALAGACGVAHIIPKPCEPETVLQTVESVLARATTRQDPGAAQPDAAFDREHLRLVTDKLREKTDELHTVNAKLTALIEVSQQLALERDPQRLFTEFTRAARQIIGARYALVARAEPDPPRIVELFASGLDLARVAGDPRDASATILDGLLTAPGTYRDHAAADAPPIRGLPERHPPVHSMLAASIVSLTRGYGWVCVTEKIGLQAFSPDDERILAILGAQLGRIYENGRLYLDLKVRTVELEQEVAEHSRAEAALAHRARAAALGADIGVILTRGGVLPSLLGQCAAAIVRHLEAAAVSIFTCGMHPDVLERQAIAGPAGPCADTPVALQLGELLVGQIADRRGPVRVDPVIGDPRIHDQRWAERERIAAFDGFPLLVEDQLAGVLGIFGRRPLDAMALEAIGSAAAEIALGIQRKRAELELEQRERRFRSLLANASDLVIVLDAQGIVRYASPSYEHVLGRPPEDLVGSDAFEYLHPADAVRVRDAFARTVAGSARGMRVEYRGRAADGTWRVLEGIGTNLLHDAAVRGVVVNSWDVTHRQRAEQRTAALLEVAQELAGSVDLERMIDRVQRRTAAMLPCDAVATFSLNEEGTVFRLMAQRGMWDALLSIAAGGDLPRHSVFGQLTNGGVTAVINDFAEMPERARRVARRCGVGAIIAAPLTVHDRQLGAFAAIRTLDRPPFAPDQVELFTGIAKQLAVAMQARDLDRLQQEEAAVSRGLARAGRELISALGDPALLERLCQITTEVLECDVSATLLRQADDTWTPVATAGWTDDDRQAVLAVAVPHATMAPLLPTLARGELITMQLGGDWIAVPIRRQVESLFCVALLHAGHVIGVHTAGYYRRVSEPAPVQRRIAEGLGNLASLALDNVRLIERLDRANRLKSDFVGTMSHELRTPLNIIMGYDELLSAGEFGALNAEQLDIVQRIDDQAAQLLELVNATLDVSRLESGRTPLDLGDVDVGAVLDEIRNELRRPRETHAVTVHWPDPPAPSLQLYTDRAKLKVILKNLIDNAVKFTAAGQVHITVRTTGAGVEFAVADTGIGIAQESFETIFESFRQLDPSTTRHYGGVGLGLYLARRLTEMLGGTIDLASEVGRGSTFRVELPLAPEPAARAAQG